MKTNLIVTVFFACLYQSVSANELGLLEKDCFNEWKTRQWVLGEDKTPAYQVPRFAEGIKQICETRARLFKTNPDISPYIQGRIAELAPYIFSGDNKNYESLIRKIEERPSKPQFSGAYMRD